MQQKDVELNQQNPFLANNLNNLPKEINQLPKNKTLNKKVNLIL